MNESYFFEIFLRSNLACNLKGKIRNDNLQDF